MSLGDSQESLSRPRILVIGGTGQLGRHLREVMPEAQFLERAALDLSDLAAVQRRLEQLEAEALVNAAAYTAVDRAESEPDLAWRVNAEAPALLARYAERKGIPIVHISTDYVFDGSKSEGYVEGDAVNPLNQYGLGKLGGELAVRSLCRRHWILRTSWLFSEHGANFPKTMLRLARERTALKVVDDQRGRPTYAGDLARCIRDLLCNGMGDGGLPWGVHHVGNGRVSSWKEFAEVVLERAASRGLIGRIPEIQGIPTREYPTPAARPRNSVLLTGARWSSFTANPFDWERGLDHMLNSLQNTPSAA